MTATFFDIYVIDTFPCSTNHYKTSREESWSCRKIATCDSLEDAKQLVRDKSRQLTDLPHFLVDLPEDEKTQMIDDFCFHNDMYIHYRRVFIGRPPVKSIMHALTKQGISVIKQK